MLRLHRLSPRRYTGRVRSTGFRSSPSPGWGWAFYGFCPTHAGRQLTRWSRRQLWDRQPDSSPPPQDDVYCVREREHTGERSRGPPAGFRPESDSNTNAWFSMDQISFDSGSATLRPESQAQLDNIAPVLSSCPSIHLDIAGFTDNVGSADSKSPPLPEAGRQRGSSAGQQRYSTRTPDRGGLRGRGPHRRQFHGAGPRPESARRHARRATVST